MDVAFFWERAAKGPVVREQKSGPRSHKHGAQHGVWHVQVKDVVQEKLMSDEALEAKRREEEEKRKEEARKKRWCALKQHASS